MKKNGKKNDKKPAKLNTDDMLPEYDFSGAVRGKHYKKFRKGVNIRLLESGQTTRFVVLDDDLKNIFPDSKSVNDALRHIVAALPKRPKKKAA